jgi:transcriptional regulator GlxA family with amidase domain
MRRIVIACFPGLQPLDVVGPHEVFAGANRVLDQTDSKAPRYELDLCAQQPGAIASESGLNLFVSKAFPTRTQMRDFDTLLIPGGYGVYAASADAAFVQTLRELGRRARRLTTVCSGTFLGAATGLLDGKRVTTHWARAEQLATAYPALNVDADPIFINDGNVWTSAGVTAGIDLALALVEADHGAETAQTVARHLVMFLRRPGGQSQFAAPVWTKPTDRQAVRAAQDLVVSNPAADLRVGSLAAAINMSERHFTRLFAAEVGEPPAKFVERIRVEAARRCLEQDSTTVAAVARQCGFGTAETMRRSFLRRVGVAPDDYRRRFTRSVTPASPTSPTSRH